MTDTTLQLMLTGEGLEMAVISTPSPHVHVTKVVRPSGGRHLFAYLDLQGCEPGTITLRIKDGTESREMPYVISPKRSEEGWGKSLSAKDVVYLLMPDRFARSAAAARADTPADVKSREWRRICPSGRAGGDIRGVTEKLPYLHDLGVTALWLTPVLQNNMPETQRLSSYHGYAITDYYAIDSRFGTLSDYVEMVQEAHRRGLKVVMDMVFNHCGSAHPWLAQPPMADWFNHREWLGDADVTGGLLPPVNEKYLQTNYRLTPTVDPYAADVDRRQTVEGWFVKTMPDLNLRNPHLLRYLTQTTLWWIETAGIDAIRMDTFPYADKDAMQQWLRDLHREYPWFKVVGETWVSDTAFSAKWQEGELDSTMDFALFEALNHSKREDSEEPWSGMNRVHSVLSYDFLYEDPQMVLTFLDNHDVNRFLEDFDSRSPKERKELTESLKRALAILLTVPRIPQLYYGTEVLMSGTTQKNDGYVRLPFPGGMPGDRHDAFTASGRTAEENEMHRWLSRLLKWRKGCEAVHSGRTKQFLPHLGVYVLVRQTAEETVMTIVNGCNHAATFSPQHYEEVLRGRKTARNVLTNRDIQLTKPIRLTARKVLIIEIKNVLCPLKRRGKSTSTVQKIMN